VLVFNDLLVRCKDFFHMICDVWMLGNASKTVNGTCAFINDSSCSTASRVISSQFTSDRLLENGSRYYLMRTMGRRTRQRAR